MQIQEHVLGENKIFVEHLLPDKFEDSSDDENDIYEHPIIFVHGAFSGHFIWQRMSSFFAERKFECFSLSLRGHNASGGELKDSSLEDYVEDIRVVVEELNIQDPILIGHSMGGLVSLMYASKYTDEVKSVIGLDPATTEEAWNIPIDDEDVEQFGDLVTTEDLGAPKSYQNAVDMMPDMPPEYMLELDNRSGKESGKAWREILEGVSINEDSFGDLPILLMGVELDEALPYSIPAEKVKEMAEIYNADFLAIKETTHVGIVIGKNYTDVARGTIRWLEEMVGEEKEEED